MTTEPPAPPPRTVRLGDDDIQAAGEVLARAFQDDPLQSYVFSDPAERARLSPPFFSTIVRYGQLAGEVWTTEGRLDGVAVWLPPEHREMVPDKMRLAGFDGLPGLVGREPLDRFFGVIQYAESYHHRDAGDEHWYAMVIGVDKSRQGLGVGGSLMRPILERADRDKLPCYLETTQPRNVPFYRKQGFRVMVEDVEPASGLRLWTFLREPR